MTRVTENWLLSCGSGVEMVAEIGPVILNPKATLVGAHKIGALHPVPNKNRSLETGSSGLKSEFMVFVIARGSCGLWLHI